MNGILTCYTQVRVPCFESGEGAGGLSIADFAVLLTGALVEPETEWEVNQQELGLHNAP